MPDRKRMSDCFDHGTTANTPFLLQQILFQSKFPVSNTANYQCQQNASKSKKKKKNHSFSHFLPEYVKHPKNETNKVGFLLLFLT